MNKLILVAGLIALTGSASAATIPTTVTATGAYGDSLSVINDGVFPADGTYYNDASSVYFGPGDFAGPTASFRFDLGGTAAVQGIVATVDNNDDYSFTFFNGSSEVESYVYPATSGTVGYGLQNFSTLSTTMSSPDTPAFVPVTATDVVVTASGGDSLYGIGEVAFSGAAVSAAPEPGAWALMIAGVGMVGLAFRQAKRRQVFHLTA